MGGVLEAAGAAARSIATISWVLIVGATVIFAAVMALLAVSLRRRAGTVRTGWWIVGGGLVFPGAVLAALFVWTVPMTPAWKPAPPPGALVVSVTGYLWWWEVRYRDPATRSQASAGKGDGVGSTTNLRNRWHAEPGPG